MCIDLVVREALKASRNVQNNLLRNDPFSILYSKEKFSLELFRAFFDVNNTTESVNYSQFSGSFCAIFSKNVNVTNIQYNEFISLIQTNSQKTSKHSNTEAKLHLSFLRYRDFRRFIENIFDSMGANYSSDRSAMAFESVEMSIEEYETEVAVRFLRLAADIIENTVVVDFYSGTCVCHIPLSISVNFKVVVSHSGYIHSGGSKIIARNMEKVQLKEILERLTKFLEDSKHPMLFMPYTEEAFLQMDKNSSFSVRNGLDQIKLSVRKHFISDISILDILEEIRSSLSEKIVILPGVRSPSEELGEIQINYQQEKSIWMITDRELTHEVVDRRLQPSSKGRFLLCYEQAFLNNNHLLTLKERKPGWYAPVTLPHTLSSALLNIGMAFQHVKGLSERRPNVILDPFCGSGTTLIDAAIRNPKAIVVGFDRNPLTPKIIKDNLEFFSKETEELTGTFIAEIVSIRDMCLDSSKEKLIEKALYGIDYSKNVLNLSKIQKIFLDALRSIRAMLDDKPSDGKTLHESIKAHLDGEFSKQTSEYLNSLTFHERILWYVTWRSLVVNSMAIRRAENKLSYILSKQLNSFIEDIKYITRYNSFNQKELSEYFSVNMGEYSLCSEISCKKIKSIECNEIDEVKLYDKAFVLGMSPGIYIARVDDSINSLQRTEIRADLIVTDPPYGFNTIDGSDGQLSSLYSELARSLVRVCRPIASLMLVLPAYARNGRAIPFNQTQGFLVRKIIAAASENGSSCIDLVSGMPAPKQLFEKPMYWTSTQTLDRNILVFHMDGSRNMA